MKAELLLLDEEILKETDETELELMIKDNQHERLENESLFSFLERQTKNQIRKCLTTVKMLLPGFNEFSQCEK
jgi:hypothetical protein